MYKGRKEIPEEGQLCICRCPNWCASGYQIANFQDGVFQFDEQPNDLFDKNVIGWLPLNEEGNPILKERYLKNSWEDYTIDQILGNIQRLDQEAAFNDKVSEDDYKLIHAAFVIVRETLLKHLPAPDNKQV